MVQKSNDVNRKDEGETGKKQELDYLLEELDERVVFMLAEVKEHADTHQSELSDKVDGDYKNCWKCCGHQRQFLG
jgi:hypothetical protein